MNSGLDKTRIGTIAGGAGEWMHYAGATWLAYTIGGPGLVALYLVAVTLPGAVIKGVNRAGGFLAPAALALLSAYWLGSSPQTILALGLVTGVGHAAARRPTAWTSGLNASQGVAAIAGGATAVALAFNFGIRYSLAGGALLLFVAWLLGEEHEVAGPVAAPVVPAMMGVGFAAGIRVLESGFLKDQISAALFVAAWALGVHLGWRASNRADARAVLAAPFAAGGLLAVFGIVEGPVTPFLYMTIAGCVGLVGGTSEGTPPTRLWSNRRIGALVAAMSGAAWSTWMIGSVETLLFGGGAVAVVGGFVSYSMVRRAWLAETRVPEAVPARAAVATVVASQPEPAPAMAFQEATAEEFRPQPASERAELSAVEIARIVSELRSALTTARAIRADAMKRVAAPTISKERVVKARSETLEALDKMISQARKAAANLT
jgi:hypothetical protein